MTPSAEPTDGSLMADQNQDNQGIGQTHHQVGVVIARPETDTERPHPVKIS